MNKYLSHPELKTPIAPNGWHGTPLDDKGLFVNLEHPFQPQFSSVLKWQTTRNPQKEEKKNDPWKLKVNQNAQFLDKQEDMMVWLGHCTFYIRLDGISYITDPVLWNVSLVKRKTELPLDPKLLKGIDYILLSHAHRDHCDEKSMKLVCGLNPQATILTGLKIDKLLAKWNITNPVQAAGWYQQYQHPKHEIIYLPTRHWARRGLLDFNTDLWGAFYIKSGNKTIYFGGDSGFGSHFKQYGEFFPGIDIAMLGCGAYSPRWFMHPAHTSPEQAVDAFNDIKAKTFLPMHYGTFDLSDEPLGEPVRLLQQMEKDGLIQGEMKMLEIGEEYIFIK